MKSFLNIILALVLSSLLIACGDEGSSQPNRDPRPNSYSDYEECRQRDYLGTGIKGNSACPYKGEYDPNLGYQGFAIQASAGFNFEFGRGFYIDYGWDNKWESLCPYAGQVPVFMHESFSHCIYANPTYGRDDDYINTSSCTGSQYNPEVTGCTPRGIRPTGPNGYF